MTELLWHLGITHSPSRMLLDGHGYSRLGCWVRGRRYTTARDFGRMLGDAARAGYEDARRQ